MLITDGGAMMTDKFYRMLGSKLPEPWHRLRYAKTMGLLSEHLSNPQRVLDCGGSSPLTSLMRQVWPSAQVDVTGDGNDLRTFKTSNVAQSYDLVVLTEVIEHLADLPTDDPGARAMWTGSGQRAVLLKLRDELKRGGLILITTPNALDVSIAKRVMQGSSPRTYDPHVRELTQAELKDLVVSCGYNIVQMGLWDCWNHHNMPAKDIQHWKMFIGGHEDCYGGDNIYCLAKVA